MRGLYRDDFRNARQDKRLAASIMADVRCAHLLLSFRASASEAPQSLGSHTESGSPPALEWTIFPLSWPGIAVQRTACFRTLMSRPSTTILHREQDVDARHEAGHDAGEAVHHSSSPGLHQGWSWPGIAVQRTACFRTPMTPRMQRACAPQRTFHIHFSNSQASSPVFFDRGPG